MNRAQLSSLTLLILLGISACSKAPPREESIGNSNSTPSSCRVQGNKQGEIICATSMSSILMAPDQFDGKVVSFVGWAEPVNDVVVVFSNRDTLQMRDTATSVVIYPPKNPEIEDALEGSHWKSPELVRLTGVFRWTPSDGTNSSADPIDRGRVGVMENVSISR